MDDAAWGPSRAEGGRNGFVAYKNLWFARFRDGLLANPLVVTTGKVDYHFGKGTRRIGMFRYDVAARDSFRLPRINDTPIDLHPEAVYQSPFLKGVSNSDRITVTVGPVRQVLDFAGHPQCGNPDHANRKAHSCC